MTRHATAIHVRLSAIADTIPRALVPLPPAPHQECAAISDRPRLPPSTRSASPPASCTRAVWLVHSVHGVFSAGDWLDHAKEVSRATVRSDRPRRPMGLLGHPDLIGPWHPRSSATRSCRRRVRPVQPIRDGADEIGSGKRSLGKSTGNTSDGASTTPWGEWGDGCLRWDVAFS